MVLVPPAGWLEAIVKGPADGRRSVLRTRCVDTGPDGDPTSAMILADVVPGPSGPSPKRIPVVDPRLPAYQVEWLDTINVPVGGSVDVIMDFTDPVIRGKSVFHCHLINHEDKDMMAKILFQ